MAASARATVKNQPRIEQAWCKGCGICVAFCPTGALFLNSKVKAELKPGKCKGCAICALYCPDFAVSLTEDGVCIGGSKAYLDARQ